MSRLMRLPDYIWHYTTAEGLMGIVANACLRLADARFLNDRREREYGRDVVVSVLDVAGSGRDPYGKHRVASKDEYGIYHALRERFYEATRHVYVSSWSERPDAISQWQRYGGNGEGYCISLKTSKLVQNQLADSGVQIMRVAYGVGEQRHIVREYVEREIASADLATDAIFERDEKVLNEQIVRIIDGLEKLAVSFKSGEFADEREWRFVKISPTADQEAVRFLARAPYVKPYREVILHSSAGTLFPLGDVICGPRLDQDLAVASIETFLGCSGYGDVSVHMSDLEKIWR